MAFVKTVEIKEKYHSWTVIKEVEKKWGHRAFLCKCDCGTEAIHPIGNLLYDKSKRCYKCSIRFRPNYHGKWKHYLYSIWSGIIQRTTNPNAASFLNYGHRGITVCDRWKIFINFYKDIISTIGERPSDNHLLDRINNDGNYEIDNVKWSTPRENSMNRRITLAPGEKRKNMIISIEELKRLGYFDKDK